MKARTRGSRPRRARRRNDAELEWIGGCLTPPFFVTDRDEPYRPTLVVWLELPSRLVVGQDVVAPEASPGAVGRTLLTALERPLVGPARRPSRMIRRWEEEVADLDAAREIPPELRNTDGDPLLATTDHFEIVPAARPAVEAQLAAMQGVEPPDADEDPPVYVFLRPGNALHASWDNTVMGRARLSDTALQLETNSRERADALRKQVEAACGERIRHRAREHADPLSRKAAPAERDGAPELPAPEAEQLVLEFKQRHYADWLDQPLPALGGNTPREVARTAQGRAAVDVLLKDMENREQRSAGDAAFDFSEIRRELRLE